MDLCHRELTTDVLDRALDAVVTSQACDINAACCDEEFWDGVGEGAVGVTMLRHRLGDVEQRDAVAALDAPEEFGQRRIDRRAVGVADAVRGPRAAHAIEAAMVGRVLVHGHDDGVVVLLVLLDPVGQEVHGLRSARDSEGAADKVDLRIDDEEYVHVSLRL